MNKSRIFITKLCGYFSLLLSVFFVALLVILTSSIDRYIVWIVDHHIANSYDTAMLLLSIASVYLCLSIIYGLIMTNVYFKVLHFSLIKRKYFTARFRGLIIVHAIFGGTIVSLIYGIYTLVVRLKQPKVAKPIANPALDDSLQEVANAIELLRKEYFMGNISKDEYAEKLNSLLSKK